LVPDRQVERPRQLADLGLGQVAAHKRTERARLLHGTPPWAVVSLVVGVLALDDDGKAVLARVGPEKLKDRRLAVITAVGLVGADVVVRQRVVGDHPMGNMMLLREIGGGLLHRERIDGRRDGHSKEPVSEHKGGRVGEKGTVDTA